MRLVNVTEKDTYPGVLRATESMVPVHAGIMSVDSHGRALPCDQRCVIEPQITAHVTRPVDTGQTAAHLHREHTTTTTNPLHHRRRYRAGPNPHKNLVVGVIYGSDPTKILLK